MRTDPLSRRGFLAGLAAASLASARNRLPQVDYHVHLGPAVSLDDALAISRRRGVKFGIVEHAGTREYPYPGMLNNDGDLDRYLARLEGRPVYKGIQAEGLDWMSAFSKQAVARLDYVLSDALTLPQKQGPPARIWTSEFHIPDKQEFMDRYTDFNVQIMAEEPLDIIANPTYLPDAISAEYDTLWTHARMQRIVDAAVKYRVAIEINSAYRVPRLPFLKMARAAGAIFSFGSNIHTTDVGNIDYGLEMARALELRPSDVFTPSPGGRKPIEIRKFGS